MQNAKYATAMQTGVVHIVAADDHGKLAETSYCGFLPKRGSWLELRDAAQPGLRACQRCYERSGEMQ